MSDDGSKKTFKDEYDGAIAPTKLLVSNPKEIQNELDDGRVHTALLLASTKAEAILERKIEEYFEIHHIAFEELDLDKKSLGWFYNICCKKGLIDSDYRDPLGKMVGKRNNLAHDYGYLTQLINEGDEKDEVNDILEECCEWFNSRP